MKVLGKIRRDAPRLGEHDRPAAALEEGVPELGLQLLDVHRHG